MLDGAEIRKADRFNRAAIVKLTERLSGLTVNTLKKMRADILGHFP